METEDYSEYDLMDYLTGVLLGVATPEQVSVAMTALDGLVRIDGDGYPVSDGLRHARVRVAFVQRSR